MTVVRVAYGPARVATCTIPKTSNFPLESHCAGRPHTAQHNPVAKLGKTSSYALFQDDYGFGIISHTADLVERHPCGAGMGQPETVGRLGKYCTP